MEGAIAQPQERRSKQRVKKNPIWVDFGLQVKKLREKKEWTTKELANKCMTSEKTIEYIEAGTAKLSYDEIERIPEALGCSLQLLLREPE